MDIRAGLLRGGACASASFFINVIAAILGLPHVALGLTLGLALLAGYWQWGDVNRMTAVIGFVLIVSCLGWVNGFSVL